MLFLSIKKWQTDHKKLSTYMFLLSICGKIFERLMYNRLYEYLSKSLQGNLVLIQGIRVSISYYLLLMTCINLQTMILKLGLSFLTYLKAFDKHWHKGLISQLKQNRVAGNLLNTSANFLKDTKQKVVLNGQHSTWVNVEAGVLQSAILGPQLFLIYV